MGFSVKSMAISFFMCNFVKGIFFTLYMNTLILYMARLKTMY